MMDEHNQLAQNMIFPMFPLVLARMPFYLPWTQRILNPFPLASSGNAWGDSGQPWPIQILAFYCTVYVVTTNNATNYWTVVLIDQLGNALAGFNTSAIGANTFTRFAQTSGITQPATTNTSLAITATATLNPGAIYIMPAVAALITG